MRVAIRAASREDVESLGDALGEKQCQYFLGRFPAQQEGLGEILLAFAGGRPVGGVFLSWDAATEPEVRRHLPGVPIIFNLHVTPARRHRGAGRALLRRAEANLRDRGHERVLLGVDATNTAARDLYLWLGYTRPSEPELRGLPGEDGDTYDILVADLRRDFPGKVGRGRLWPHCRPPSL